MQYLVTGCAGFIGFYVCKRLLEAGHSVVGIDNMNDYYSVELKRSRLSQLANMIGFIYEDVDLTDRQSMAQLFNRGAFERVVHLAAQAGVRYSLDNPMAYADSNLIGHLTVLEGCRKNNVEHLVYASSSSVYGLNTQMPFSTSHNVDHPVSLYAATKKANELMSHSYSHLYNLPTTGLRFFTVYGPWGRPDMALFKFTRAIMAGEPIDVYNYGELSRDFTYIDDIVEGIIRVLDVIPKTDPFYFSSHNENVSPSGSSGPYQIYNIGNGQPVRLMAFIEALEHALDMKAIKNMLPMQPGDVYATWADTDDLFAAIDYQPKITVDIGVSRFVDWYRDYYKV